MQNARQSRLNLLGPIKESQFREGEVGKVPDDLSLQLVRDLIDESFSDDEYKKYKKQEKKRQSNK